MPLSDTSIRNTKPSSKAKKVSDGGGLYLHVSPSGGKYWRMAYRFEGRQKLLSFGAWPYISLKEARQYRDDAKTLLAHGVDPAEEKKRTKAEAKAEERNMSLTFAVVASQWFDTQTVQNAEKTRQGIRGRLDKHVLPYIGTMPVSRIEFADLVAVVRRIEAAKCTDLPRRVAQIIGQIFEFATLNQYIPANTARDITRAVAKLPPGAKGQRAAITDPVVFGELLRRIDDYRPRCSPYMYAALRLAPMLALRSGEMLGGRWEEIDLDAALWTVPAGRMKCRKPHDVPLPHQAVEVLVHLRDIRNGEYVFPSTGKGGHVTDEGLLRCLRTLGYGRGEMCVHGFRAAFSTMLRELGHSDALIEKQLAHVQADKVIAAYDRSVLMERRRELLQAWADYLDGLRDGDV